MTQNRRQEKGDDMHPFQSHLICGFKFRQKVIASITRGSDRCAIAYTVFQGAFEVSFVIEVHRHPKFSFFFFVTTLHLLLFFVETQVFQRRFEGGATLRKEVLFNGLMWNFYF